LFLVIEATSFVTTTRPITRYPLGGRR
jgi:hypothetical protein